MAMKLKEFDFKGFLLQKGERFGLYIAGGIALLMIVLSLFLPGKGLFSPSPKKSAAEITKLANDKKIAVNGAKPGAEEAENLRKVPGELQKQASNVAEDPAEFRLVAELFAPHELPSSKRQNPSIFGPEEFKAAFVPAQISTYMIKTERDGVWIGIVEGSTRNLKGQSQLDRLKNLMGRGSGGKPGSGFPFPGGGGPGSAGMAGMFDPSKRGNFGQFGPAGGPPGSGTPFGDDKKNLQINFVKKEELSSKANPVFARDLLAAPMYEIVGSFPLKKQIDEYKNALRADSDYNVVFQETAGKDDKTRPAFQFLGFNVKRRTLGPDGKVIPGLDGQEWQKLDLESPNSAYVQTAALVLKEFAPEDPKIAPLLVHGLYLPRPIQVPAKAGDNAPAKSYPDVEKELPKIQQTLDKMKTKEVTPALPPSKFDEGSFNPFGDGEADKEKEKAAANMPKQEEWAPPEYCVLRFLDLTVQPGQTYEYQVQVRMQNPNWEKPESEVANKQLTVKKELESEWYPVKGPDGKVLRLTVPQDLFLYCVDQKEETNLGQSKPVYKGMAAKVTSYDMSRYVPIQIQRWMPKYEHTRGTTTSFFPVGDWVVGERIFASRGELVGVKKVQTHIPVWSAEQSQFILAGRPPARAGRGADTRPTEEVNFIEARRAPLLVDFDGGNLSYRHAPPPPPKNEDGTPVEGYKPPQTTEVKNLAANEMLLLTPDGRLLGHSAFRDAKDEKRVKREEEYTERVSEAESKEEGTPSGKPDPFGGKPKP